MNLESLVAALSLQQKVRLLTGADFWSLHPEPAVGLRRLVVSDGPAGVRGEIWDERDTSVNVPSPTALAATWDEARVEAIGRLLAAEARRKGVDVLLAPTVNLHRSPYGGRHFECFSEDPLLTARIGVAYVRGVQGGGVGATVKHFVANDSETQRMTLDARVDERTLRELYLAPFEAIVREGEVWAVMAAYNGVNGATMTENPLLRDVLRDEWGFDGVVMSDWFATGSTEAAANAALDLVMPGPSGPWGEALVASVRAGAVPEAAVDEKVLRILRLAARVGALDTADTALGGEAYTEQRVAAEVRAAAAAGFVLVRNEGGVLPLGHSGLRRVAVLGPNAEVARTLGGGSATVFPPYTVSPLDGLRAAVGDGVEVTHAIGVVAHTRTPIARPPWLALPDGSGGGTDGSGHCAEVRYLDGDGSVLAVEPRDGGAFNWVMGSFPEAVARERLATIEVRALIRATEAGTYLIGSSGLGRHRLIVAGQEVYDVVLTLPPGADIVEAMLTPPQRTHPVRLAAGESIEVTLVHDLVRAEGMLPGLTLQLNLETPHGTDDEEIERAVALARDADVAVVVVGTNEEVESEGFDRTSLALPGRQDELVRRVAAANPRTIVVVNSGAPVLLPWHDEVAAVLLTWFPGQEYGNALADVLFGRVEPGGRLPTSWPLREGDHAATQPVDGVLTYDEGPAIGYRGQVEALYPFGHGLGYTTWEYGPAKVRQDGATAEVTVLVRNTGDRPGREVVQVYASRPDSAIERSPRWLAGFATVDAASGEEVAVTVTVRRRAVEHWDVAAGRWAVEPGTFRLEVGSSSAAKTLSEAPGLTF
ncbi:beta-glucosidase [Nonomuraea sp. NEAU-A123]|uniref:beta-glucosidase family protein n=1 Tax=Nonomuraea sp. NEAU-A123 TaxID=2839649 RepID=UPI001BE3E4D7|nr:glycoside hydrolase family 3 C-terminal domain-containing protein [Nonomuraea sp. NEAU-A123]MBT2232539.1 glycoside hydrolase family 3 C-terminal domain-containing protein [Nonomuraea sp. NEAU-A123]